MLPKKHRLTFQEFFQNQEHPQKYILKFLQISVKKNNLGGSRFVISVPKYLDKRSTKRHATRRWIVEIIRKYLDKLNKPVDVLIKPKRIIGENEKKEAEIDLNNLLNEILNS